MHAHSLLSSPRLSGRLLASIVSVTLLPLAPATAQSMTIENFPTATQFEAVNRAPYEILDNVEGSWINLNVAPVRPMTMTADQLHIYAVNTHGNVVQHYANLSGQPTDTFRVPWGPVSVAIWPDFAETELLVVCQGSHVLVRLDRVTGETLATLDLPFEPSDLIVDHVRGRAFISCKGVDSVVEVDLATNAIVHTYTIPSKSPVFLSFDANGTDVLVAPMFSGNNSFVHKVSTLQAQFLGIIDGETNQFVVNGLPDEDLFRIDPVTQSVEAVLVDAGTVLFGHGINPATGDLWMLNTEANNKDPNAVGEPAINGFAVHNRLSIATLNAPGGGTVPPHTVIDLDDTDAVTPGVQYDPARSVGQPYSIEFDAAGNVLITGLLTDNITALRPGTSFLTELDLADGSIPRQTMLWGTSSLFVYCWGTNVIEMWDLSSGWTQLAVLDLGHDPTPELIRQGRQVFYDASHSLNNNQSCASCHVEGKTDIITWDLSDLPRDDKGPMVTQTLAGIDLTPPFHWRGERPSLIDFNPAFPGLLGGTELDETSGPDGFSEFDRFEAFVLSLATTANPFEDRLRVLSDATTIPAPPGFPVGSPVNGRIDYFDPEGTNCQRCHTMPMGTNNIPVADARFDPNPKRTHLEVAHYKELWRKEQPSVTVDFVGGITLDYPVVGSGLGHAGTSNSLFDFIDDFFALDAQGTMDMVAFVMLADQGLAPLVHEIEHLNAATVDTAAAELAGFFLPQADERHIDLAAYGTIDLGDGPRDLGWYYDRHDGLFHAEDSEVLPRRPRFFLNRAQAGQANLVFVGLPVGMGKPFAADSDDDGLLNLDEFDQGTNPFNADSDNDGAPDGYEVQTGSNPAEAVSVPVDASGPTISNLRLQWITGAVAKLSWETDEPTTYQIDFGTSFGPTRQATGSIPARVHTAVLSELFPSTAGTGPVFTYTGTLTAFDLGGNPAVTALPAGMTTTFFNDTTNVVLGDLHLKNVVSSIPTATAVLSLGGRVDAKIGGPPAIASPDHVVIASVIVNGVQSSSFTSPNPTTFLVEGEAPQIQGPWVISVPSDSSGVFELDLTLTGIAAGDHVRVNVDAVIPIPPGYDPLAPDFTLPNSMGRWDFPTTPEAFRAVELSL